jgi:hypothetical protein
MIWHWMERKQRILAPHYPISLYTSFITNKINDLQMASLGHRGHGDERRIGAFDTKHPLPA